MMLTKIRKREVRKRGRRVEDWVVKRLRGMTRNDMGKAVIVIGGRRSHVYREGVLGGAEDPRVGGFCRVKWEVPRRNEGGS